MMAELSLSMSSTVVRTANGPLKKTSTASCGTYVKRNMKASTPADSVSVGTISVASGFQSARCVTK